MKRFLLCSLIALMIPAVASATLTFNAYDSLRGPDAAPGTAGEVINITLDSSARFDCIIMGAVSPDFLPPTVMANFSVGGWNQAWASQATAVSGGPATASLNWDTYFAAPVLFNDSFHIATFFQGSWTAAVQATWTPNGFLIEDSRYAYDGKPTPEPATWIALIAGLGVLGVMRFRG